MQRQIQSGGDAESLVVEVMDERERIDKKIMEIERIEKIIEHVTKKTKNGYSFEPKQKLVTLKDKLREIVSFFTKELRSSLIKETFFI